MAERLFDHLTIDGDEAKLDEDEEYIRGWKCAMLTVLEKIRKVR